MDLCIKCEKSPIYITKRRLCKLCYQALRREDGPFLKNSPEKLLTPLTKKQIRKMAMPIKK